MSERIEVEGKQLISDYQAGHITEGDFIDQFIDLVRPWIYPYLRRVHMPVPEDQVEDIFQEFMLKFHLCLPGPGCSRAGRGQYDVKQPLRPFLRVMGRNVKADYLRRNRRHEEHRDPFDDAEAHHIRAHLRRAKPGNEAIILEEAYAVLTDAEQELMDIYIDEGLTQSEIAERLSMKFSTVQGRVRTAMRKLKKYLEERYPWLKDEPQ